MFYKKEGTPEEDELVLCTVTKVQHNSVFVKLDEYGKTGMINIYEISPGRIRNIRDFVQEGKKIVCKVLRVDKIKGHIDLSLRRVNEGQRRKKMDEIKQEMRAEKIIESFAKQKNRNVNEVYEEVSSKVFEKYEYIFQCFNDIVEKDFDLQKLGIEKGLAEELSKVIKEKIKPAEVKIRGIMKLVSYAPDGVEVVRKTLQRAETIGKGYAYITYAGAGSYNLVVTAPDYKIAEKILKSSADSALKLIEKLGGEGTFERTD